ncbi:unnamed protein product [Diatraea saccharalis]|uniref:MICOS complex subunit n=1 Tax=Diatraea saccharalis TaxID=40085 RepID=A0A9N9N4K3_9NEOP|nr:unnamed protein product [Diatraea saccharalis]
MIRNVAVGSSLVALIPTLKAASPVQNETSGPPKPPPMRYTDLPIYEAPHAEYGEFVESKSKSAKNSYIKTALQPPVKAVREQVQYVWDQTETVKHTVQDHYHEFRDRSDWILQYLREEANKEARYGAVVMGGLTGFIFGLRGGIFRRLVYTGLGTTGMGLVCFPEETKEIIKTNGSFAKQYINIAYNFLYGVKPGDPQLEIKFPELSFPKDFSEFVDLTVSMASSVKQAVMPPPAKESLDSKQSEKD